MLFSYTNRQRVTEQLLNIVVVAAHWALIWARERKELYNYTRVNKVQTVFCILDAQMSSSAKGLSRTCAVAIIQKFR